MHLSIASRHPQDYSGQLAVYSGQPPDYVAERLVNCGNLKQDDA